VQCGVCDGNGKQPGNPDFPCVVCHGSGKLRDNPMLTEPCKMCDGTGKSQHAEGFPCVYCKGYKFVAPRITTLAPADAPLVMFVEAGKPRTAHLHLEKIVESLSGEIRICDPYYGIKSLYRLDSLKHCKPIKFLTQRPDANETQTLSAALQIWKQEHGDVEFRRETGRELHDRFLLSADELILLGHGLKDIGNKDSFIVRIGRELAGDLIDTVRDSFDMKWAQAAIIV
jgi:hypothetical protein